ncbi:hypothetical protein CVT25_014473 [Psilocybe cyanescens]|uniref:C3H1-type domain-containing protein n=1 Tax=Psilocybe cyanescens TaxID=93625 RepID=A0A409XRK3_PSICY|nr:hypothetical protein CVT25_014473 [Psilocybe cyanescens]
MPPDTGSHSDDRDYDRDRDRDRDRDMDRSDRASKQKPPAVSKSKDLSHVPCKFFKVGGCTAGSSCPFSHSSAEPGGQKETCTWFIKGNCKFGHKCALAHVLPGQSMAMDRKNKKAAQHAAASASGATATATGGGHIGSGTDKGPKSGGGAGRVKRDASTLTSANHHRLPLLAGGATAPTRDVNPAAGSSSASGRPPMNMALKATISPSAPAPTLKDTDFFAPLEEMEGLPSASSDEGIKNPTSASTTEASPAGAGAASAASSDETPAAGTEPATTTTTAAGPVPLPLSAPRLSTHSSAAAAAADFGPIGSPPNYRALQPTSPTRTSAANGAFSPGTSPRTHAHLNGITISSSPSAHAANNAHANAGAGFLSSSPFSAPGTQSVFLSSPSSYSYATGAGGMGMAASLGSGLAMMGGARGRRWADPFDADAGMESGSPGHAHSFSGLLSSSVSAQRSLNNNNGRGSRGGGGGGGYDISIEYDDDDFSGVPRRRTDNLVDDLAVDDEDLDVEDFLPSSLNDLLTPEERSRRMSRSNSNSGSGSGGATGAGAGVSYLTNALANATKAEVAGGGGGGGGAGAGAGNYNAGNGNGNANVSGLSMGMGMGGMNMGHRYSRSVPAPTLLGDIKSIWASADSTTTTTSSGLPSSPPPNAHAQTHRGTPSISRFDSYLSASLAQQQQQQSAAQSSSSAQFPGSGAYDELSMSMGSAGTASSLGMMSPSNASAAFLPGVQQNYLNAKAAKQAQAQLGLGLGGIGRQLRGASNPLFSNSSSTAANNNGNGNGSGSTSSNANNNNSLASNYMSLGLPSSASAGTAPFQNTHTHTHGGTQTTYRTTPSPFDLTQGLHAQQQQQQHPPASSSPARALQQHAPGQSLPQGLAAGYSRIHALPPLKNVVGSPPGGSSGGSGLGEGYADWTAAAGNGNGNGTVAGPAGSSSTAAAAGGSGSTGSTGAGPGGLETMFSRLSYSAATRGASSGGGGGISPGSGSGSGSGGSGAAVSGATGPPPGLGAPPGLSRNVSAGRYAQVAGAGGPVGAAGPLSPLSGPVMTRDDDDLFDMDK